MSPTPTVPQQQSTKGPRRSGKKSRPSDNLEGIPTAPEAPVAPADHKRTSSPAAGSMTKNGHKAQPRKVAQPNNKSQSDGFTSDRAKQGSGYPEKAKGTPMKPAAYAGSAFQQSPAASALPLPSFYSKSLPTATSIPPQPTPVENPTARVSSATPADDSPSKRESTPCDFLFEAARQAKSGPRADSPATRSGNLSVPGESPASKSPAPREGDSMFPFELEGGAIPGEDGSAFATPYKDRIDALRSTRSTSNGKGMDEHERKAKTEALKKLLMKSSGRENDDSDSGADLNNPFNAKALYQNAPSVPHGHASVRHGSGPTAPVHPQEHQGYNFPQNFSPAGYQFPPHQAHTPKRPNSSRLRHVYGAQSEPEYAELSSDSAITPPISTRRHHPHNSTHHNAAARGQPFASQEHLPTQRTKPSAQQLEDDLRRVLKLDLTSRG